MRHKEAYVYWLFNPPVFHEGYIGYTVNPRERLQAHRWSETKSVNRNASNLHRLEMKLLLVCSIEQASMFEALVYRGMCKLDYTVWNAVVPGNLPSDPAMLAEWARRSHKVQIEKASGIFGMSQSRRSELGKKGGKVKAKMDMKNKTGIFGLSKEQLSRNGRKGAFAKHKKGQKV